MNNLLIKGYNGSVEIEVSRYERPEAKDPSDANWLSTTVDVRVGPFTGHYAATLTTYDFAAFRTELEALLAGKIVKAVFAGDEGWLRLEITIGPCGSGKVNGEASCNQGVKSKLSFSFETDQTFMAETLRSLMIIVKTFPVKG